MAPVLVSLYGISRTKQIIMLVVCKIYARFTAKYAKLCLLFTGNLTGSPQTLCNKQVNGKHLTLFGLESCMALEGTPAVNERINLLFQF